MFDFSLMILTLKYNQCKFNLFKTVNKQKPPQLRRGLRVVPTGLEPVTLWLWVRCSNQLSYGT